LLYLRYIGLYEALFLCVDMCVQIRVNAVNPTVVMTEMGQRVWSDAALADPMRARIPLGKFAGNVSRAKSFIFMILVKLSNKIPLCYYASVPAQITVTVS